MGPPQGTYIPPQPAPPRPPTGSILAIATLAAMGAMFMCCCGGQVVILGRGARLHQRHENRVPMPNGLLDRDEDTFEYLDEISRRNEEHMNEIRRQSNERMNEMRRRSHERLERLHRRLDEF
jgi:hypothetical protein